MSGNCVALPAGSVAVSVYELMPVGSVTGKLKDAGASPAAPERRTRADGSSVPPWMVICALVNTLPDTGVTLTNCGATESTVNCEETCGDTWPAASTACPVIWFTPWGSGVGGVKRVCPVPGSNTNWEPTLTPLRTAVTEKLAKKPGGNEHGVPAQLAPYWNTIGGRELLMSALAAGDTSAIVGSITTAARETATVSTSTARIVAMRSPARVKREIPRRCPIQIACVPISKARVCGLDAPSLATFSETKRVPSAPYP